MKRKTFLHKSGLALATTFLLGSGKSFAADSKRINAEPKIIRDNEGSVLNVIGDVQTHKLVGKDTGNQIVEWVDNVEPGVGIPPHIHTKEDEIFRVIYGEI